MIYLSLPILAWQGRRIRVTVPRLPEAGGPTAGTARGDGTPLRIAVIGDSTAAGVGAQRHEAALPGYLAAEVARHTGRAVHWRVLARSGATAASVRHRLVPRLRDDEPPHAVSVTVGVNDLLKLRLRFKRAPGLNRRLLHQVSGSVGPAGLLLADDSEMYERNQRGVASRAPEWLALKRGLHRERIDEDGHLAGAVTDETTQRGIWRHIKHLMTEGGTP